MIEVSFTCLQDNQETAMVREESVLAAMYRFQCSSGQSHEVEDPDIITILKFLNGTINYKDIACGTNGNKWDFINKLRYYNVFESDREFIKFLINSPYYETLEKIMDDIYDGHACHRQPYGPNVYYKLFIDNDAPLSHYICTVGDIWERIVRDEDYPNNIVVGNDYILLDDCVYILREEKYIIEKYNPKNSMAVLNDPIDGAFGPFKTYLYVHEEFEFSGVIEVRIPETGKCIPYIEHLVDICDIHEERKICISLENTFALHTIMYDIDAQVLRFNMKEHTEKYKSVAGFLINRFLKR